MESTRKYAEMLEILPIPYPVGKMDFDDYSRRLNKRRIGGNNGNMRDRERDRERERYYNENNNNMEHNNNNRKRE